MADDSSTYVEPPIALEPGERVLSVGGPAASDAPTGGARLVPVDHDPFADHPLTAADAAAMPMARQEPTMQAADPSWRDRLRWGIHDVLTGLGMPHDTALHYSDRFAGSPLSDNAISVLDAVPGIGQAMSGNEAVRDYNRGNYLGAATNAVGAVGGEVGKAAVALKPTVAILAGIGAHTAERAAAEGVGNAVAQTAERAPLKTQMVTGTAKGATPPPGSVGLVPVDHDPFADAPAPPPVATPVMPRGPNRGDLSRSTDLPDLRTLPVDQATAIAQRDPHLIKSGDQSEGYFVGSPRDLNSKRGLTNQRKAFDEYVAADPRGSDWYDRYRNSVNEVTGGNPVDNDWMTKQHGQWSAGVSPEGELAFTLKENNGALAGFPVKSARPAQHEAFMRGVETNDPNEFQLGDKTGMYAQKISPDQPLPPGATGVNDFRYARQWGYTERSGKPQKNAITSAAHRFIDYETANAVARANKVGLGGRTDWTGEALQAAPWVRQKAEAILERRPALLQAHLDAGVPPDEARRLAYEDAFKLANTTIGDFFNKHTAFATHEAIPGADTGHLPGAVTAPAEERAAYSADPRSTWANAPGDRDAIYAGLRLGDTGVSTRVRPTLDMQGLYTPPGGVTEANPGFAARPLVSFDAGGVKTVPVGDRAILDASEATRAYIDAQNAGAWHKPWMGGKAGESNSYFLPMDRKATPNELQNVAAATGQHGLGDVADTGQGLTVTSFWPGPPKFDTAGRKGVENALASVAPEGAKSAQRVSVDANLHDYVDAWKSGVGSGAATQQVLNEVNKTPELRAAFNNNPFIPQNALNRLERDEDWAKQWGATRPDIQNARRIIGQGPGWIDRLEKGLKSGAVLPAIGAAIFGPWLMSQPGASSSSSSDRPGVQM